ncbi:MAG: dual specificity protein phosphatase family protein [Rhodospirillales bacterium]|jgi:predicted protein tyrosine phosphatase|nr:dual specificity protein phosphatase family protein [Rhodospirillales bacterium]
MNNLAMSDLVICGVEELPEHGRRGFTHVATLIDPDWPEITAFDTFDAHERRVFLCHDIIDPLPGKTPPSRELVEDVLSFGRSLSESLAQGENVRLLIHCHKGVSRSSAAMLSFLAQVHRDETPEALFNRLRAIRPQAWPNSVMVGFIDEFLDYDGALVDGLRVHYGHRLQAHPRTGEWMSANGRAREVEMAIMPEDKVSP